MSWSINGVLLSDLGVDSLGIRLRNQDDDYSELRFQSNFDAELPSWLQQDAYVDVRYNGSVVFRGYSGGKILFASAEMEYKSLFIYGPWNELRKRVFYYNYPYVGGGVTTTHGFIGGNANSLIYSILSQASDILSIGTIDLGNIQIPATEIYDMTLAQAIQIVLRFIPGALVIFDYSTSPPLCSVLSDDSNSLQANFINAVDGSVVSIQITPHEERRIEGVQLFYEASRSIRTGEYEVFQDGYGQTINTVSSPTGQSGFYIAGIDIAGNWSARRRVMNKTLKLSGAYDQTTYTIRGQIFNRTLYQAVNGTSTGVSGNMVDFIVWRSFFSVFGAPSELFTNSNDFQNYINTPSLKGFVTANTGSNSSFKPLISSGKEFNSFIASGVVSSIPKSPAIPLNSIPSIFLESPGLSVLVSTLTWSEYYQFQNPVGNRIITAPNILFVDPSNFSNGAFTKTISSNNVEMPSGIAQKIYSANSRLLHDGKVTISPDNITAFFGNRRRISISPVGVVAPIQEVYIDSATNIIEISFGAPNQLGPQDYISLLRAGTA